MRHRLLCAGALLGSVAVSWGSAATEPPREAEPVPQYVFGQSAALNGPAGALGMEMRLGLLAAFQEVNREGGPARDQRCRGALRPRIYRRGISARGGRPGNVVKVRASYFQETAEIVAPLMAGRNE